MIKLGVLIFTICAICVWIIWFYLKAQLRVALWTASVCFLVEGLSAALLSECNWQQQKMAQLQSELPVASPLYPLKKQMFKDLFPTAFISRIPKLKRKEMMALSRQYPERILPPSGQQEPMHQAVTEPIEQYLWLFFWPINQFKWLFLKTERKQNSNFWKRVLKRWHFYLLSFIYSNEYMMIHTITCRRGSGC